MRTLGFLATLRRFPFFLRLLVLEGLLYLSFFLSFRSALSPTFSLFSTPRGLFSSLDLLLLLRDENRLFPFALSLFLLFLILFFFASQFILSRFSNSLFRFHLPPSRLFQNFLIILLLMILPGVLLLSLSLVLVKTLGSALLSHPTLSPLLPLFLLLPPFLLLTPLLSLADGARLISTAEEKRPLKAALEASRKLLRRLPRLYALFGLYALLHLGVFLLFVFLWSPAAYLSPLLLPPLHLAATALHLFLKLSLFTAQAPIYTDLRVIS